MGGVKTEKDLIIPFSWEERHPILLDRMLYIPHPFDHQAKSFPFFEREQPVIIEFCSGNGQWIVERAQQNRGVNWIAVEKRFERARKIWMKIHNEGLTNLFVVCSEALIFTRYYAPMAKEIFVNFPDPWPKFRHSKHRLVRWEFLEEVQRILLPEGKATCVTDHPEYKNEMVREFEKCSGWKEILNGSEWPNFGDSFFKDLWERKGKTIHYLSYEKI